MSEANQTDTFTERVDVTTQPDGAFIGTLEIETRPADRIESEAVRRVQELREELTAARDQIAELECLVNKLQAS